MFNLSSYLEKFKNLKDPKENKTIISEVILGVTSVSVAPKNISIQRGTVFVEAGALQKNLIFLNKEEILKKISESLPDLHIKEIL